MGLSLSKIKLLKYIQEANYISLQKCAEHFEKDTTTIRREIQTINNFCEYQVIKVKHSQCSCTISYQDYLKVIKKLTNYDYFSSYDERLRVVICKIFFEGFANTSELYSIWNLSLTTKKNDMVKFRKKMQHLSLKVDVIRKKGLTIEGNDLLFRFYSISQIYSLIEIRENNTIDERIANTPFEHQIYCMIYTYLGPHVNHALDLIQKYISKNNLSMTYNSKKMLLLFLCSLFYQPPKEDWKFISKIPFPFCSANITDNLFQNEILGILFTILDLSNNLPYKFDKKFISTCNSFVNKVQNCLTESIYTESSLKNEVYYFFHKELARSFLSSSVQDKLVKNVDEHYPVLFEIIQKCVQEIESTLSIHFTKEAISTITLIFQKFILKNEIYNNKRTKIILVTGIPFEKLYFYQQQLNHYFDIEIIAFTNLYNLPVIDSLNYDYILTFSERTYNIVNTRYKHVLLTNFFINNEEFEKLLIYGFQRKRIKILASKIIEKLNYFDNPEDKLNYLLNSYPDIFI